MGSIPDQFPISLRAWPSKDDKAVALPSVISRINVERGSFRTVTEESLQEEINKSEAGVDTGGDNEGSDDGGAGEGGPDRLEELMKAREEILGQLEQAHNASMVALDFVSLLLSKDAPVQASLSISPALRDAVALGTLGADIVQDSRATKTQKQDNRRIAKGWKVQSLSDTVDSVLASAVRLATEIEKETKYWEQILAVSDKGWAICRLPQERHTLGVRFGFAESAAALNNRSLGALRRNLDGTIYLDQGVADSTLKRVRIRIQTDGVTTGESSPLANITNLHSIESLILRARNSIFEEELWQELNREARILANQGVHLIGDEIVCPMTSTKRIVLDLQYIKDGQTPMRSEENNDDGTTAEIISLSLHLLLSYAHRQNLHRRSQRPPPISNRPPPNPPYNLLRPIIARLHHQSIILTLNNLLAPLSKALVSAGTTDSPSSLTVAAINSASTSLQPTSGNHPKPPPERIIDGLISNLSAEFTVPLVQSTAPSQTQSLTIHLRTIIFPLETRFQIMATGPLAVTCKPPPNPSSVGEVKGYILWATACALAEGVAGLGDEGEGEDDGEGESVAVNELSQGGNKDGSSGGGKEIGVNNATSSSRIRGWHPTHNPTVLRKLCKNEMDSKELSFKVVVVGGEKQTVEIRATYKYVSGGAKGGEQMAGRPNELTRYVWRSEDANKVGAEGIQIVKEAPQLRQVVADVGRWNGGLREDGELGFGEGYETIAVDWE